MMKNASNAVSGRASVLWCLLGGVLGGVSVWIFQGHSLSIAPAEMTYPDLAATLLMAATLIVAIFGTIFGLAAILGYTQFRRGVEDKTRAVVEGVIREHLIEELREGPSRGVLEELVARFLQESREKPGVVEAWTNLLDQNRDDMRHVDEDVG